MIKIPENTMIQGSALEALAGLPAESVQMCVTSPPYWGLRDYGISPLVWGGDPDCRHLWEETRAPGGQGSGVSFRRDKKAGRKRNGRQPGFCQKCGAWRGCLGLEPTIELYVEHIVMICREIRRVLQKDGTFWLNMGDSYATGGKDGHRRGKLFGGFNGKLPPGRFTPPAGLKHKDLCGIPWRVAFALQADGWWLRSRIPWLKMNCMPESAKDRPTTAIDDVFLLTKSAKYYYDFEAIKMPASQNSHSRGHGVNPKAQASGPVAGWDNSVGEGRHNKNSGRYPKPKQNESFSGAVKEVVEMRNRRNSDWFFESWRGLYQEDGEPLAFIVNTKGYKQAHFATFPPDLIRPCIQAGTSEHGACPECGVPWERVIEKGSNASRTIGFRPTCGHYDKKYKNEFAMAKSTRKRYQRERSGDWWRRVRKRPGKDAWPTARCVVLDPFMGAGTTALVCEQLDRKWIGIELNPEYIELAERRLAKYREQLKLNIRGG